MYPDTSSEACQKQLEPYHDQLHEIVTQAVKKFSDMPKDYRLPLVRFRRSTATAIWALAMEEVFARFPEGSHNGYPYLRRRYDTIEIHFAPNLVGRIKKMDEAGFTANYPTKRARAYHGGGQGELFESVWAKPMRVDIGYVLNEFATGVKEVKVVRRKSPEVIDWKYLIKGPHTGSPVPLHGPRVPSGDTEVAAREKEQEHTDRKNA